MDWKPGPLTLSALPDDLMRLRDAITSIVRSPATRPTLPLTLAWPLRPRPGNPGSGPMWRVLVSKADTAAGQATLGFVNTCVNDPVLAFGFFAIMLMLVGALWVEMLNVRPSVTRSSLKPDDHISGLG